mmetsp:Transcript_6472/g.14711  ORF Transcript_6472/g.14711 Transcript_6472/m.14711 type:complete len:112 (-) Transcript_6472:65-400(-)
MGESSGAILSFLVAFSFGQNVILTTPAHSCCPLTKNWPGGMNPDGHLIVVRVGYCNRKKVVERIGDWKEEWSESLEILFSRVFGSSLFHANRNDATPRPTNPLFAPFFVHF